MSYEIVHIRDSNKILKSKKVNTLFQDTVQSIHEALYERFYRGSQLKSILDEMGWRDEPSALTLLEGRRYQFKGLKNKVALEANLSFYEWILEGVFRLQVGFDKGVVDTGILLLNNRRGEKSPLGDGKAMVEKEIEALFPTISMPLTVVLFDLGVPLCIDPNPQELTLSK